ncbi:membrane protein insertion efficiency factor YidD [candidate division WOR-3 bacterium]|nr:membrane protein insertion efficiency factor YidD [candidate division WOR-3 bacterium]
MQRVHCHSKKRSRLPEFRGTGEAIDNGNEKSRIDLTAKAAIFAVEVYRHIVSPLFPRSCRFYPSCSEYAKQALMKYGLKKGVILSLKRILRCNPFCAGGYDPLD